MEGSFRIGDWIVEPDHNRLVQGEHQVKLDPKVMQVLLYLAARSNEVVRKEQVIETVWEGAFVTDEVLTNAVWELRKALGDDAKSPQFIQTVPRKGYRLLANVRVVTEEQESGSVVSTERALKVGAPRSPTRIWMATALLAGALGVAAYVYFSSSEPAHPPPRTVPLTSYPGPDRDPALSPDGSQVAFTRTDESGVRGLYVMMVDGGAPLLISRGPGDNYTPAWKPDGQQIAFFRAVKGEDGKFVHGIFVVSALGGAEREIATSRIDHEGGFAWPGLSWSPDGKHLAMLDKESPEDPVSIFLLSLETGEKQKLTTPPRGYVGDRLPQFSPDGRTLAFVRETAPYQADIYVTPVEGGEPRRLTLDGHQKAGLDWTSDGRTIVFSSLQPGGAGMSSLWRVTVSGGEPEPLEVGEQGAHPSLSRQGGRLSYTKIEARADIWRVGGPYAGEEDKAPIRFISSTWYENFPQYSPDGQRILFGSGRSGSPEIWICNADGANPRQLTFLEGGSALGRWSPDGKQIAFMSSKEGSYDVYVVNVKGGFPRRLTMDASDEQFPRWSRDGRWIYFYSSRTGRNELFKIPAEGGDAVQLTTNGGTVASESPDGRFVYFAKSSGSDIGGGPRGIWRIPVDGGEEVQFHDRGEGVLWEVLEQGICYLNLDSHRPVVELLHFGTREVSQVAVLPKRPTKLGFSVSLDGRWVLYQIMEAEQDIMLVENFH